MISFQLAQIMKTLLVKRIDSSFYAFKQSLKRFSEATNAMVLMFENNRIYIAPNLKVNNNIELEKKAIMKLQAFHSALGEDSQIYSPDKITESFDK